MVLTAEETERFDVLYRKHSPAILRVCLAIGAGNRQWAFDRTQDAFVKLAREFRKLDHSDDLGRWLYRVAVNECRMNLRRRGIFDRVRGALSGSPPRVSTSPERDVQARHDADTFEYALSHMPPRVRVLMALIYQEGKTQSEAGAILGVSKGQASKLHKKALQHMRALDWELDL